MSVFEALMLICFGIGWPVSIIKSLKTKVVKGKSPLFMAIVFTGYASGIVHKAFFSTDWVIVLYVMNFVFVGTDLLLYYRYRGAECRVSGVEG